MVAALGVEGRVAGHEEVEVGRRDERRDQTDQVVVHVRRVPEHGSADGHDGGDELVDLREARLLDASPPSWRVASG